MTLDEIIEKYLKENNFDGVFNEEEECACFGEDLLSCGGVCECEPGLLYTCPKCKEKFICRNPATFTCVLCRDNSADFEINELN